MIHKKLFLPLSKDERQVRNLIDLSRLNMTLPSTILNAIGFTQPIGEIADK